MQAITPAYPQRSGARRASLVQALRVPFYLYFGLILLLPVSANGLKAGCALLLALATFGSLAAHRRPFVGRGAFTVLVLMQCTGLAWILYGLFQGTPGAIFSLLIYAVWPVFYLLSFTEALRSWSVYRVLRTLMLLVLTLLSLFILYFVAYSFGLAPATPLLALPFGQGIAKYDGFTALRFYSISSLIFLIPYGVAKLLFPPPGTSVALARWTWAATVLGIAAVMFTGRRAALLIVALSLPLALLLGQASPLAQRVLARRRLLGTTLLLLLGLTVALSVSTSARQWTGRVTQQVSKSLFDPEQTSDDELRYAQSDSLLRGWVRHPLVGSGLGATSGYLRSDRSWNYELQYHLHLFQMGLLGSALYAMGLGWIFWQGLRLIRQGGEVGAEMTALLTGLACFLIANASNPYLQAYGHLWTLFLPVAVINLRRRALDAAARATALAAQQRPPG